MALTPKQERFCQSYLAAGNASEAYRQAYTPTTTNPATINRAGKALLDHSKIATRLNELRGEIGKRNAVTVDSLITELEEARQIGRGREQAAAMVAATLGKAKLMGFDKDAGESDDTPTPVSVVVEIRDARRSHADA
jgi:phage terminase small subunit